MKVIAFISAALSASHLLLVGAETAGHFGDASGQVVTATGDLDAVVPRAQKKRFDVIESMGEYNPWEEEEDDDLVALLSEHVEASSTLRKGKKKKKKKKKSGKKKKGSSDDKADASDDGKGGDGGGDGDDDSECDDDEDPNNNDASNPANPNNDKSGGDDNPSGSGSGSGPGSGGKPKKGGPGGGDGNDPAACAARNAGAPGPPTDMSLGPGSCSDGGAGGAGGSGGAANPSGCSKEGQAIRAKKQLFEQRMICDMRKLLQMERDKQKRLAGLQHACKDAELLQKAHKFLKTGIRKMLKGCTPDGSGATSSGSGDASAAGSEGQPAAAHRRENMAQPLVPIQENDPILRKMYEAASDSGLPVGLVDKELASAATAAAEGQKSQDPNH